MAVVRIPLAVVVLCACSVAMTQSSRGMWVRNQERSESYVVSEQEMNWGDAWDSCVKKGGHLLILETEEEIGFIVEFLQFYKLNNTLVGLHDLFKSGKYTTILGEPMSKTAFKWADHEPSGGNQHCAGLHGVGTIFDMICDAKLPFICEKTDQVDDPV